MTHEHEERNMKKEEGGSLHAIKTSSAPRTTSLIIDHGTCTREE
jgi:hypothetical protein